MDSSAEQNWLLQTLNSNAAGYYVGLTRGTNDTWNRINNQGVIDFELDFYYGEPNNQFGDEDCIEINGYFRSDRIADRLFKLNDTPCKGNKFFVCVFDG